jgi:hypothetical protein
MKIAILFLLTAMITAEQPVPKPALSTTIASDKKVYKIGEIPKIEVRIINNSKDEVYLVGSLDGSDVQWRMPYCYFTIDKPIPDPIVNMRCGNTNSLRLEDFVRIKPTGQFDPYQLLDNAGFFSDYTISQKETFRNTGTYKIRFHYSTNSTDIEKFKGRFSRWGADSTQIKNLFEKTSKVDLVSDELEIKFEK